MLSKQEKYVSVVWVSLHSIKNRYHMRTRDILKSKEMYEIIM